MQLRGGCSTNDLPEQASETQPPGKCRACTVDRCLVADVLDACKTLASGGNQLWKSTLSMQVHGKCTASTRQPHSICGNRVANANFMLSSSRLPIVWPLFNTGITITLTVGNIVPKIAWCQNKIYQAKNWIDPRNLEWTMRIWFVHV